MVEFFFAFFVHICLKNLKSNKLWKRCILFPFFLQSVFEAVNSLFLYPIINQYLRKILDTLFLFRIFQLLLANLYKNFRLSMLAIKKLFTAKTLWLMNIIARKVTKWLYPKIYLLKKEVWMLNLGKEIKTPTNLWNLVRRAK